jgi:lysyl-tRNA synthetase class 2
LLAEARRFFAQREVLEVDTPIVVNAGVTDVHIHSACVQFAQAPGTEGSGPSFFLHTSPEYAMKRLLAAGSGDIFQICHVARALERGDQHNAEFTLIEWYRVGYSLAALMSEVGELVGTLLGGQDHASGEPAPGEPARGEPALAEPALAEPALAEPASGAGADAVARPGALPVEQLSYRQAFLRNLQLDPFTAPMSELADAAARTVGYQPGRGDHRSRDELLELLMGAYVGPRLGHDALTFVHAYPASQAALARLDPQDPRTALRFELYCRGMELANGFQELSCAVEQRTRFEQDNAERARLRLPTIVPDERLLAALEHGLPECSGVALGFDRVLMLATGATSIDAVMPFPIERA